jgi:hypothetical protein
LLISFDADHTVGPDHEAFAGHQNISSCSHRGAGTASASDAPSDPYRFRNGHNKKTLTLEYDDVYLRFPQ